MLTPVAPDVIFEDEQENANPLVSGFANIPRLLQSITRERTIAIKRQLTLLDRDDLIDRFRSSFFKGKREATFLISDELTRRGIPPCFRLSHLSRTNYTTDQTYDLFLADVRWLRRQYPDHPKSVKYERYRQSFDGNEKKFDAAAEYIFYKGKRPFWHIVRSMKLTEAMQFECWLLKSAPVALRNQTTHEMRDSIFKALHGSLEAVRRTKTFTDENAKVTCQRRLNLWVCQRMTNGPTKIGNLYERMTGEKITPQTAARQLEIINEVLRKGTMQTMTQNAKQSAKRTPLSE